MYKNGQGVTLGDGKSISFLPFQIIKLSRHSHKRFHKGSEAKNVLKGAREYAIYRGEKAEGATNYFEK
jgi:hypothetical protein